MTGAGLTLVGMAGSIAYSFVSVVVSYRLLRLARRTRQLPELLTGIMFFSGGFLGNTLTWLPELAGLSRIVLLKVAASFFIVGGCLATLFAAWRIFRRREGWAKLLVGLIAALSVPAVVPWLVIPIPVLQNLGQFMRHPLYWGFVLVLVGPYAWMAAESLYAQMLMRRRMTFGLSGDPELADRMRFWGWGAGLKAAMFTAVVVQQAAQVLGYEWFPQSFLVSVFGLACSACIWRAFFPGRARARVDTTPDATAGAVT